MGTESWLKVILLLFLADSILCQKLSITRENKQMVINKAVIKSDSDPEELNFSGIEEVEIKDMTVGTFTIKMQSPMKNVKHLSILFGNVSTIEVDPHFSNIYIDSSNTHTVEIKPGGKYQTEEFILVNNKLKRVPKNLSSMTNLKSLILHHNLIESVELAELNALSLLDEIHLGYNKIMHINLVQAVFPRLLSLNLRNNNIKNIELDHLTAPLLQELNLQNNQLETANMSQFNSFKNLATIHLTSNNIKQVTPDALALPKLKKFTIGANQLRELDFQRWNTPTLEAIGVERNQLKTVAGLTIAAFPALQKAALFPNPFNCRWLNATLTELEARSVTIAKKGSCDEAGTLEDDIAKLRKDTAAQREKVQKLETDVEDLEQIYAEGLRRIEQLKGK